MSDEDAAGDAAGESSVELIESVSVDSEADVDADSPGGKRRFSRIPAFDSTPVRLALVVGRASGRWPVPGWPGAGPARIPAHRRRPPPP